MAVEAMETDKGWMNVPMAVGTFGAVRIVPHETGMKVPMAMQAMQPNKATVNVLMAVQTVVRNVTMTLMIVSMVAVVAIISAMS
jgi:hypothetical protein